METVSLVKNKYRKVDEVKQFYAVLISLYMPSLMMQEMRQAMADIPNEQEEEIRALMEGYEKEFERWSFQLL